MVLKLNVRKIVTESTAYPALFDTNVDARSVCGSKPFRIRYLRQGGFVFISVSVFVSRTT